VAQRGEIRKEDLIFNQCYLCKEWWLEEDLVLIKIPDQAGYVEKPVCVDCLWKVKEKKIKAKTYFEYVEAVEV